MKPLRLAFIGDPNSVHVRRWMAYFCDRGHEAILLEGFGAEIQPGLDPRVRVERYQAHGRYRLPLLSLIRTRRNLRRALDRIKPDVLHAHFVRRYGWQAGLAGFHPLVVSGWGSDVLVGSLRTWRVRWRDRQTLRAADLVTVVSPFMREAIIANGARAGRVELVHHGVDTARFAPGPAERGLAESRRIILSPRAIRPLYRHETVIAAFATLPDDTLLVMSALDADPVYLAMLRGQMRDLGITERVRVLDRIGEEDLPGHYRSASVVVSVPESDSFPVTLLEAMACGTPIVAGDLPPIRAVLEPLAPEALVPIGDWKALAVAIVRMLDLNRPARDALGSVLREHVVRTADYTANMSLMEELYRRLVDGP
ncbi:MAG: glycosyltransferase [Chloroflexi bacterium]|nr:glycosyltransferase [Chloroflexota bacterium]